MTPIVHFSVEITLNGASIYKVVCLRNRWNCKNVNITPAVRVFGFCVLDESSSVCPPRITQLKK